MSEGVCGWYFCFGKSGAPLEGAVCDELTSWNTLALGFQPKWLRDSNRRKGVFYCSLKRDEGLIVNCLELPVLGWNLEDGLCVFDAINPPILQKWKPKAISVFLLRFWSVRPYDFKCLPCHLESVGIKRGLPILKRVNATALRAY